MEDSRSLKEKQELKRRFPSKRHGTEENLNVRLRPSDMPVYMQEHALRCTRQLLDSAPKPQPSLTHLARAIKKEFDSVYGPAWQCVIGTSFGSFVTHSPAKLRAARLVVQVQTLTKTATRGALSIGMDTLIRRRRRSRCHLRFPILLLLLSLIGRVIGVVLGLLITRMLMRRQ
ncbi:hypothetical protein V6Z11_A11G328300 [Gossypium hirsutum]